MLQEMRAVTLLLVSSALGCGGVGGVTPSASDAEAGDGSETSVTDAATEASEPSRALLVTPSGAIVYIDLSGKSPLPAQLDYRAEESLPDGTKRDVTSATTFSLDDPVGSFSAARFTSSTTLPGGAHGFTTLVRAKEGALAGVAGLTVVRLDRALDLWFLLPYMGTPSPARGILRVVAGSSPRDLSVRLSTEPNADGVDTSSLLARVRAMEEGDSTSGCAPRSVKDVDGDGSSETFPSVADAVLCFEVKPVINMTTRLPMSRCSEESRFFAAFADVVDGSGVTLERRVVVIAIPVIGVACK